MSEKPLIFTNIREKLALISENSWFSSHYPLSTKWTVVPAQLVNLGGTAGIPSRPIVDGSFVFKLHHAGKEKTFVTFVSSW